MRKILSCLCVVVMLCYASALSAQDRVISGKVTGSDDGLPLPQVSVFLKGTNTGMPSDLEGNYRLTVPSTGGVLVFRYLGYVTQEVEIGDKTIINVVLVPDVENIGEVVVTGYGDFEKKKFSGSASQVTSESTEGVPMANFEQILQGQASGLLIQSGSGQPGSAAAITIRGTNSISSGTTPLFVVDGVPVSASQFASMNPNDFATTNVLKDASATAMYGSRGANGVIVITTKKGKPGQPSFTYSYQYGWNQQLTRDDFLPVMNGRQKVDFELLTGGSGLSGMSTQELDVLRNTDTDWVQEIFRVGTLQSHEVTASGGNENTTFYISGNYFSQEGHVINTGLDRYTLRANVKNQSGNFNFGTNFSLGYTEQQTTLEGNAFIGSPLNAIYWANPYETPYDANGDYTEIMTGQPNAVHELMENPRTNSSARVVANVNMGYDFPFMPGLSARTNWGVDWRDAESRTFTDPLTYSGQQSTGNQGALARGNSRTASFVGTTSINYERQFRNDHELNVGLYQEINYTDFSSFNFTGFGIVGRLENENSITAGTNSNGFIPTVGGNGIQSSLASFFALADYGYAEKYFLSASVRRDGSSRFGDNNKFATFYSVGGAWIVSDEDFLSGNSTIDNLKLRASFGTAGNQNIGDFGYIALVNTFTGNPYDGLPGKTLANVPNPDLKWESKQSFNVGIDVDLLAGRISGSVDYFVDDTKDLLMNAQLSRTTGFQSQLQNVGQIRNSGVELSIKTTNIQSGDFTWETSANVSYIKNEVVKLADGQDIIGGTSIIREGEPINSSYVVPYVGVNPANGDALYLDIDGNITNQYDPDDRRVGKPRQAPYFGGFTNTFRYKGFTLTAFFNWVYGNEVYNNERTNIENPTYFVDGMAASLLNAWQTPGQVTDVPRIQTINGLTTSPFQSATTRYIEDGSYLRLRNVTFSYAFPAEMVRSWSLKSVRLFVQGQNLMTWTKFTGTDPETANGAFVGAVYPALRTYTVGVNVGF